MINQLPNANTTNLAQNKQPLTAALYARVSTNRQEEQETIESQLDEIKARITSDGNVLPTENIFVDDGWTGEMLQRPSLDAMRDAAQEGKFQILYVYDRGRLSRVFAYQEIIIEELIDKGIEFVTLHDIKATTPEERVLQAMQGVFHEYERVKIAERMRRGKLFKAKNGVMINGNSLYGWNYVKKTDKEAAHYEINEEQARVVRMIFNWVGNERVSLREVRRRLYDMGIPPRKQKSEFWTQGPIIRLLQNEAYTTGIVYYNKSEAVVAKKPIKHDKYKKIKRNSKKPRPKEEWIPFKVPVILEGEEGKRLFEEVQKILDRNKKFARKNRKYDYLVSDRAFCECGNKRVGDGSSKNGHFYYRCAQRIYNFPIPNKCTSQGVNAVLLDTLVWMNLVKFLKSPKLLKEAVMETLKTKDNTQVQYREREQLESLISKIIDEEKRYAKAYGTGTLEFDQFTELMKDARKRKGVYQKQLDELNQKIEQEDINKFEFEELFKEAKRVIAKLDLSNKFQTVKDIIDEVFISERRGIEVCGHIPLAIQKLGDYAERRDSWITKCR